MQNLKYAGQLLSWRLSRDLRRQAKVAVREAGDLNALDQLLRHSIAYGHSRLIVRRYLLALALGSPTAHLYAHYFNQAIQEIKPGDLTNAKIEAEQIAKSLAGRDATPKASEARPSSPSGANEIAKKESQYRSSDCVAIYSDKTSA